MYTLRKAHILSGSSYKIAFVFFLESLAGVAGTLSTKVKVKVFRVFRHYLRSPVLSRLRSSGYFSLDSQSVEIVA